jgi:hypothetical protein
MAALSGIKTTDSGSARLAVERLEYRKDTYSRKISITGTMSTLDRKCTSLSNHFWARADRRISSRVGISDRPIPLHYAFACKRNRVIRERGSV